MVILIASEQAEVSKVLAEHLAGAGDHQVFTASGMGDLEEAASSLEDLNVLLFSAAFNGGRGPSRVDDGERFNFSHDEPFLMVLSNYSPVIYALRSLSRKHPVSC